MMRDIYYVKDLAERTGVTVKTIYNWMDPVGGYGLDRYMIKLGGRFAIRPDDWDQYLKDLRTTVN